MNLKNNLLNHLLVYQSTVLVWQKKKGTLTHW